MGVMRAQRACQGLAARSAVDFIYLKPGRAKDDTRGDDFFIGEEDLMEYLDKVNIDGPARSQRNLTSEFVEAGRSSGSDVEFDVAASVVEDEEAKNDRFDDAVVCDNDGKEDPNVVSPTDDPTSYTSVEGDSDSELPIPPEMRFNQDLVSDIGGMTKIASGSVSDEFLNGMACNGWSILHTQTPYEYLM
ncbi:hypothetical protein PHMEG_0004116 [Phytophthora megakarya]|uniref:Uncharacterized protein n=1 Tax=Phytophthora megakarya TaxID=4795 RepID=A0A225WUK0_9STRA|nr:hypothetical protein PHMEG_0004116 [Phytophthora megakarya]